MTRTAEEIEDAVNEALARTGRFQEVNKGIARGGLLTIASIAYIFGADVVYPLIYADALPRVPGLTCGLVVAPAIILDPERPPAARRRMCSCGAIWRWDWDNDRQWFATAAYHPCDCGVLLFLHPEKLS